MMSCPRASSEVRDGWLVPSGSVAKSTCSVTGFCGVSSYDFTLSERIFLLAVSKSTVIESPANA